MINSYGLLYPLLFCLLSVLLVGVAWYRFLYAAIPRYRYSLASFLAERGSISYFNPLHALWGIRFVLLVLLALLASRPQWYDANKKIQLTGIDIMLVLDVSGSMLAFDDLDDPELRIETALKEAEKFIDARVNDQIGLVLFAKEVVSRAPLTSDKNILKQIIKDVRIGLLDHQETMLGCGMLAAINRLKDSQAATKLLVVLTDGMPSEHDIAMSRVIDVAREIGIKIYTIGVGSADQAYVNHPPFGIVPVETSLNEELLEEVAQKTGGAFFRARNPEQMRQAYKRIDELEKTEREDTLLYQGSDWFKPCALFALMLALFEYLAAATWWFVV